MPAVFCITSGTAQERPWGLGGSRKWTFSEHYELTKTETVSPYGQRNCQRFLVCLFCGECLLSGAWTHSNQRVCVLFGFVRFGSIKNSVVLVWWAEMTERVWKRRRNCVAFRWTGWLIPLGIKGERWGTAEISTGKRISRNYYNSNRDQDKESLKNKSEKIVWSLSMILIP